jgi:hypothetical protein
VNNPHLVQEMFNLLELVPPFSMMVVETVINIQVLSLWQQLLLHNHIFGE